MKKKINNLMAAVLTIAMLMTMLPGVVLTAGAISTDPETYTDYRITSKTLSDVQTALSSVAEVTEGEGKITIKLTADVKGRLYFNDNDGSFVLDLNGKTVEAGTLDQALCADHSFTGSIAITGSGTIKKGTVDIMYVSSYHRDSVTIAPQSGYDYFTAKADGNDIFGTEKNTSEKIYTDIADTSYYALGQLVITQGITSHSHPVCGDSSCTDATHTVTDNWIAVTNQADIEAMEDGNSYYLENNITLSARAEIEGAINLCLNGHKLESSQDSTIFIKDGATLNVTDCEDGGKIENTGSGYAVGTSTFGENITFNLYNGTLKSGSGYTYYNCDSFTECVFNQYGGTVTSSADYTVAVMDGNGQYNLYGGSVENTNEHGYAAYIGRDDTQLSISGNVQLNKPVWVTNPIVIAEEIAEPSDAYVIKFTTESGSDTFGTFTSGWDTHMQSADTADYFTPFNSVYTISKDSSGELCLASSYTVTYHANDGTGRTVTSEVTAGGDYTPAEDAISYLNCEVAYWSTEADGSGTTYFPGDTIEDVSGNIDLYIWWNLPLNELDSFTLEDYEWSGNGTSPYTFTMKNGAVLYANVILPLESEDESIITVNGDCEIKGSISYAGNNRASLTVKGDGSLKCYEVSSTGNGDTLTAETDMTIENDLNIGASGGQFSTLVIKDATATVNSSVVLLQYLTMEGDAKLNIPNGNASFHNDPELSMSNDSEIYIGGDGYSCVFYKEGEDNNEAMDALLINGWLPEGYSFVSENYGYYLYDAENNLAIDAITIKKPQSTSRRSGGNLQTYVVSFDTDGGSKIATRQLNRNSKVAVPDEPTKDGYTFDGWYTDKERTAAYDFESKVIKSFTLYAKWAENENELGNADAHNCPSLKFDDLDITKWYHFDTDYVIEKEIFKGVSENTFAPNDNTTRAMMITVLYRAEGNPEVTGTSTFRDIDTDAYYADAVVWGYQNGIIKGYSETEFGPDDNITREQIATIMHRYATFKGYDVSVGENTNILSYDDFDSISEYAIPSMQWAVGSGMIKGRTESTLNPKDFATRVEIAAILHRFIESN